MNFGGTVSDLIFIPPADIPTTIDMMQHVSLLSSPRRQIYRLLLTWCSMCHCYHLRCCHLYHLLFWNDPMYIHVWRKCGFMININDPVNYNDPGIIKTVQLIWISNWNIHIEMCDKLVIHIDQFVMTWRITSATFTRVKSVTNQRVLIGLLIIGNEHERAMVINMYTI